MFPGHGMKCRERSCILPCHAYALQLGRIPTNSFPTAKPRRAFPTMPANSVVAACDGVTRRLRRWRDRAEQGRARKMQPAMAAIESQWADSSNDKVLTAQTETWERTGDRQALIGRTWGTPGVSASSPCAVFRKRVVGFGLCRDGKGNDVWQ
jgi:hypothetical protein